MSKSAREVLAAEPRLRIHSVFTAAVNLRAGARLLTCTADAIRAPHGVELAPADLARLRRLGDAQPNASLHWDGVRRTLVSRSGAVRIAADPHLAVFDSTIAVVGAVVGAGIGAVLPDLLAHLTRLHPVTGFGDHWATLVDDPQLGRAVASLRAHTVDAAVLHWIGRGPGLTPSGDDVLLGVLAALYCAGAIDATGLGLVGAQLEVAARARTTDVSVEYLHYVCRGMVIGALRDLLAALGRADRPGVLGAVERLRRYGHTSGMDCLLGTVTALRQLARSVG